MRLTHLGHNLLILATLGKCTETTWRLFWEITTKTYWILEHDLEHGNQSDRDTCCQEFVDVSTIVQNCKTKMLDDTCACPVMETEPVNQGTDVLEDDSQ